MVVSEKEHAVVERPATLPVQRAMAPIVEAILAKNPTPETLDKILAIQREYDKDNAKRAFTEALVALKRALPPIIVRDSHRDDGAGKMKYSWASLSAVTKAITPALSEHGFSVSAPATTSADPKTGRTIVTVTATLTHHGGHSESTVLTGPVDDSGSKSPIQGIGASITYLQRYAILSLLGIATADMDDADETVGGTSAKPFVYPADPANCAKAVGQFAKVGKSKADLEKYVGRLIGDWTESDMNKLRAWHSSLIAPPPAPASSSGASVGSGEPQSATREPGQDDESDALLWHCPGCTFKTESEGMLLDHQNDTGHREKVEPSKVKPSGGKK